VLLIIITLVGASAYTVSPAHQVVITQFGDPKDVVKDAGLHFRMPFIQKVNYLEKRFLPWDGQPENMPTKDKKRIFIDVWARWRIVDPMKYFQAVRSVAGGQKILDDLVDSGVRDVIASHKLIECVRSTNEPLNYEVEESLQDQQRTPETITVGREKLEELMLASVNAADLSKTYGMEVTDVHIKRVNYIENVRKQVYDRMKSERTRIASLFESEAQETYNVVLGSTRKELDEIEGEMEQRSAEIIGRADAEVIRIYAESISQDPEFFKFLRQLEAYESAVGKGTRLILSTENEFLQLLNGSDTPEE
jgi:membrane protease subunit HflC